MQNIHRKVQGIQKAQKIISQVCSTSVEIYLNVIKKSTLEIFILRLIFSVST